MIKVMLFLFIGFTGTINAQSKTYVLFEERHLFEDVNLSPFKLRLNDIELQDKINNLKTLHIYNFYFTSFNFQPSVLDIKAFQKGRNDYKQMRNDVLVTMTPLTDSLDSKLVKLNSQQVKELNCLSSQSLLQTTIANLYQEFTKDDLLNSNPAANANLKTMQYKILLKRGNDFYAFNGPVLTECYLVHSAFYFFPNQYHYGEINVLPTSTVPYFSKKAIAELFKKFPPTVNNSYYPSQLINGRVFPSHVESVSSDSFYTIQYDTYPKNSGGIRFPWQLDKISDGIAGIGTFDFTAGIGIINGSYDFYVYKNLKGEGEEQGIDLGTMNYRPIKVNNLPMNEFSKEYSKQNPVKIISQE